MFDGIHKLQPGHCAFVRAGRFESWEYWGFSERSELIVTSEDELVEQFRERFFTSVKRQLVSDVPVGAFLSAGLDSSSIVAAMAHSGVKDLRTFTVSFPESNGVMGTDDPAVASRTAAHFGANHTDIRVNADVTELLPKLLWHLDEPVADPATILAYLVNNSARGNTTVLLSGVGGDELLGGYRKYVANLRASKYQQLPVWLRTKLMEPATAMVPDLLGSRFENHIRLTKKFVSSAGLDSDEMFLKNSTYFGAAELYDSLTPSVWQATADVNAYGEHQRHLAHATKLGFDSLHRMMYCDMKTFMTSLNLLYNDKMSMAASTEVRVPFLDLPLVGFLQNVPTRLKIGYGKSATTKLLLRKAMKGILPDEALTQPKAGFGAPIGGWLRGSLRTMLEERFVGGSPRITEDLIRPEFLQHTLRKHLSGEKDHSYQLWAMLTLEIWLEQFPGRLPN